MASIGVTVLECSCNESLRYLSSCFCGDENLVLNLPIHVKSLQEALEVIKASELSLRSRVQKEINKGLKRRAEVTLWLSNFRKIVPQVEDLLKKSEAEIQKLCIFGYSQSYVITRVVGKAINSTICNETMVEDTWNILMDDKVRCLGLFGIQGVGKTTLLLQINNEFLTRENDFDVVMMVVVPKDQKIATIQEDIRRRLDIDDDEEWMQKTEHEKALDIKTSLSTKKYALLFDNMLAKLNLKQIGEVKRLDGDAAFVLFQEQVGEDFLMRNPDITALANIICQKCYGLPIFINAIAQAMAPKKTVEEWRDATKSLSSVIKDLSLPEFACEEDINLSVLKFSYINLDDDKVKRCFRYCGLFPENYEMIKEELIDYWECEAFVDNRDQGLDVFDKLVSARLLMEYDGKVRMHDLVRKLALSLEASDINEPEESVYANTDTALLQIPDDLNWSVLKRISLINNQIKEISGSASSSNLTTLLLRNQKVENISRDFFLQMPYLLVLDLAFNQRLAYLPANISKLYYLRYLNLSFTSIELLPVGLKELKVLMYLNLEHTRKLQNIVGISALLKLRVLRLLGSRFCSNLKFIEELTHLGEISADAISIVETSSCLQALEISNSNIKEIKLGVTGIKPSPHHESPTTPLFSNLSQVKLCDCIGLTHLTWLLYAPNLVILHVERAKNIKEILNREIAEKVMERHGVLPFEKLTSIVFKDLEALESICWRPLPFKFLSKIFVQLCPRLKKLPLNHERAKEKKL
ncbi:unnamed protein product, partial [Brassica oleracea var. botrytis]